ncbi:MAG: hypothetical protein WB630_24505 [Candidatus Acidiferrales bacterium]
MRFGVTLEHIFMSMKDFVVFMRFIDTELRLQQMAPFEDTLMAANFNIMVGDFMARTIPKYCMAVVRNKYRNGHPDILPAGKYPNDSAKHAESDGIEIKASRYLKSWQARKADDVWLMTFVLQSGRLNPRVSERVGFKFLIVAGGLLTKDDWPAKRSETGQTIIGESVSNTGAQKMMTNWIYKCSELR